MSDAAAERLRLWLPTEYANGSIQVAADVSTLLSEREADKRRIKRAEAILTLDGPNGWQRALAALVEEEITDG